MSRTFFIAQRCAICNHCRRHHKAFRCAQCPIDPSSDHVFVPKDEATR